MEEVEFGGVRGSPKIGHDFRTHLVVVGSFESTGAWNVSPDHS